MKKKVHPTATNSHLVAMKETKQDKTDMASNSGKENAQIVDDNIEPLDEPTWKSALSFVFHLCELMCFLK